jgi:minor extracellular serine protease Vpr
MGKMNVNKSLLKKSLSLVTLSILLGGLIAQSIPAVNAASRVKTFVDNDRMQSIKRLLQESSSKVGLNTNTDQAYIANNIDTSSPKEINVIVQLRSQPAAVGKYAARLGNRKLAAEANEFTVQAEQKSFIRSAQLENIPFTINYQYNTVLNGMEITVRADQIPQLAGLANVKAIHKNSIYYPIEEPETYQVEAGLSTFDQVPLEQIGVLEAWKKGFTGKGLKVGVLDTGIDYLHPDIIGNYVEGGYDSINQDDDPYEDEPNQNGSGGSHHGTHVSGTIVGTGSNPSAVNVQKGVAYDSKLYSYKVLGPEGGTSAQVIDGIEHAVEDGMDVINLSLGSGSEKDPNSPDATAVNNAVLAGVVAVVANGNDGSGEHYYYSMGSPASSQLAISVAAATSTSHPISATVNSSVTSSVTSVTYATYIENLNLISWETDTDVRTIFGNVPIKGVYVGLGVDADYEGLEPDFLADKIVFISRGIIPFEEKVKIAAKHGAKAAILFNGNSTQPDIYEADLSEHIDFRDGPIGPAAFLGDGYEFIPTFDMPGNIGRSLARKLLASPDRTLQFNVSNDFTKSTVAGDRIAEFSSRGPNSDGNYSIKPDLSAPGVMIYSSVPAYGKYHPGVSYDKAYARLSGTSMASPHVAGLALLLKQAHPEWSPTDIRAALANTSTTISDKDGTLYDVYSQGAGRVNVMNAIDTPAIVESLEEITIYDEQMNPTIMPSEASSVSFGMMDPGSNVTEKKPLRIKNLSDMAITYTTKVTMHPKVTSDPSDTNPIPTPDSSAIEVGLEGVASNQITLGARDNYNFNLTAKPKTDAKHGVYEGEVVLESTGRPSLHLPFVIHIGKESANNDFPVQNVLLSSQTVTKDSPIDITASLPTGEMNHLYALITDMNGEVVGAIAEIYDLDEDKVLLNTLPEHVIIPEFDGSYNFGIYSNDGNKANDQLPEGRYKLALLGTKYDENFEVVKQGVAFKTFYVKGESDGNVPPTIPNPPYDPPVSGPGPVLPSEAVYNKEVAAAAVSEGQSSIVIKAETSVQGTQLSVSITDSELQKALAEAKQTPAAFVIGAASKNSTDAQLKLTAAQVKLLKEAPAGSTIAFSWNDASIASPLSPLELVPDGADYVITIKKEEGSKSEITKQVEDAFILGTPYAFEASSLSNDVATPLKLKADQVFTRSFLVGKGIDTSSAGALYLDGGKVYPVPAKFSPASEGASIVTISRPGFSTYAAATRHVTFSDIDKSWANHQIQALADKFILNGTSEHTYSPEGNVTRAQFASMLVRALGLQKQAATNPFSDVSSSDWFATDVTAAYDAGLVTGSAGQFMPNATITRQDLTVMLARAIKLIDLQKPTKPVLRSYADAEQFSDYAQGSIEIVTAVGLMEGVESEGSFYFEPAHATTREAAAKVLYGLLQAAKRIN